MQEGISHLHKMFLDACPKGDAACISQEDIVTTIGLSTSAGTVLG